MALKCTAAEGGSKRKCLLESIQCFYFFYFRLHIQAQMQLWPPIKLDSHILQKLSQAPKISISKIINQWQKLNVHKVLGSCGFQWCGFHSLTFLRSCPNIHIMQFSIHEWRNPFTCAFFVTNDLLQSCGFGFYRFLPYLKKCTSQGPGVLIRQFIRGYLIPLPPFCLDLVCSFYLA